MSAHPSSMSLLALGNGFTLWHYRANSLSEPTDLGFFADVDDRVCDGDMVLVSAPEGGAIYYLSDRCARASLTVAGRK